MAFFGKISLRQTSQPSKEDSVKLAKEVCAKLLQSCPTLHNPMGVACQALCPWGFSFKNTGVGCQALLQGIFPTQESNPGLLCLLRWQMGSLPLSPLEVVAVLQWLSRV